MEHGTGVTFFMYEDESLEVRYADGSQLQLSPCGCEFTVVKAADPADHPLQRKKRVRQRTRFAISTYKEMLINALTFRNKHASRPYLPEELIPACHKKPVYSNNLDVKWPESSSCRAERGPDGEIIIRSEEGQAVLMLSPSGEEFSVEFICNISQSQNQLYRVEGFSRKPQGSSEGQQHESKSGSEAANDKTKEVHQGGGSRKSDCKRSRFCSPKITSPELVHQSTTVVQHHSCRTPNPLWSYPLSVARHIWSTCLSKAVDGIAGQTDKETEQKKTEKPQVRVAERQSGLPQALPLTCPSPHWHRWRVNDCLVQKQHLDQELSTELVKIMWCNGITYSPSEMFNKPVMKTPDLTDHPPMIVTPPSRCSFHLLRILSGAVPVVEISPGDGSLIQSNALLSTYFTHHKPDVTSGQLKEVTYHLHNLPPDVPGQPYSVGAVLRQASRLIMCYNDTKQSVKLAATPSCLQEDGYLCELETFENHCSLASVEPQLNVTQTADRRSDLVAAELEKIKRINYVFDKHQLSNENRGEEEMKKCADVERDSGGAGGGDMEAMSKDFIAEALRRTSRALQDIEKLTSAANLS